MGYRCSEAFAFGRIKKKGESVASPLKPKYGLNGAPTLRGKVQDLGVPSLRGKVQDLGVPSLRGTVRDLGYLAFAAKGDLAVGFCSHP
jgi:hypothetical protein